MLFFRTTVFGEVVIPDSRIVPAASPSSSQLIAIATGSDFVGAGNSWPPEIRTRPILGKALPRGRVTFIVALEDTQVGRIFAIRGIRVIVREGGQKRVATIATIGIGCAYTTSTMADACAKSIEEAKRHAGRIATGNTT